MEQGGGAHPLTPPHLPTQFSENSMKLGSVCLKLFCEYCRMASSSNSSKFESSVADLIAGTCGAWRQPAEGWREQAARIRRETRAR